LELRQDPEIRGKAKVARSKTPKPAGDPLFEALREKRMALAKAQGVPPYIIFNDTTLVAMAETRPRSMDEFAALPGVGAAKLERYGTMFLDVINETVT
jgi:ATP-dependent DNA helicase RecQ